MQSAVPSPILLRFRANAAIPTLSLLADEVREYRVPVGGRPDDPRTIRELADHLGAGTVELLPPLPTIDELLADVEARMASVGRNSEQRGI